MKTTLKIIRLIAIISFLIFSSCRKEEVELVQPPEDETLVVNSTIINLIKQAVTNDGSYDNIIDKANCFNVKLPVTVAANNIEIMVASNDDLIAVEDVFDEFDDDADTLEIFFPITIVLEDYSEVEVNNYTQLNSYSNNCNGENVIDEDIECVDFIYPITGSIFNSNNEIIDTIYVNDDRDLYTFINTLDQFDLVTLDFPISVILTDESTISIDNLVELEAVIETYKNNCNEDDNYNYDDDDCNNCTTNQLITYLTSCSNWFIDQLERDNSNNTESYYDGYVFDFLPDGTLISQFYTWTYYGTWTASGTANNITVIINIPELPECNNNWVLHEIEENPDGTKVDLRLGDEQMRYVNTCI